MSHQAGIIKIPIMKKITKHLIRVLGKEHQKSTQRPPQLLPEAPIGRDDLLSRDVGKAQKGLRTGESRRE